MTSPTLAREQTINITDIAGNQSSPICIEGQTLEQYFGGNSGLIAPVEGQVALVDGLPVDLAKTVEPGVDVTVGPIPDLG